MEIDRKYSDGTGFRAACARRRSASPLPGAHQGRRRLGKMPAAVHLEPGRHRPNPRQLAGQRPGMAGRGGLLGIARPPKLELRAEEVVRRVRPPAHGMQEEQVVERLVIGAVVAQHHLQLAPQFQRVADVGAGLRILVSPLQETAVEAEDLPFGIARHAQEGRVGQNKRLLGQGHVHERQRHTRAIEDCADLLELFLIHVLSPLALPERMRRLVAVPDES
uniref:Uncharacterized protein n=1 Tax=Cereibacter sphaeroides (strain ATCC 17025 / ATH 2.4.3) TaxID=349102 RepID=A4WUU1_CERS5